VLNTRRSLVARLFMRVECVVKLWHRPRISTKIYHGVLRLRKTKKPVVAALAQTDKCG
jgi:hypothetical protein